jgi:predicted ATPase
MIVSRVKLKNWRNFLSVDVDLGERVFIVGPNASGKSNFLDAFRFLRDVAKPGGGLQKAVEERGGIPKIRCLSARRDPVVSIEVQLADSTGGDPKWTYAVGMRQEARGHRRVLLTHETVKSGNKVLLERPDPQDLADDFRLKQTHLEQIAANTDFRDVSDFLESIRYMHLVPQLVRHPEAFRGLGIIPGDPFGQAFLELVARTSESTRDRRLRKIEEALKITVPQLRKLSYVRDEMGVPHLEVLYEHWRPHGARQREDQFSDGTLRLLGLLWSLLDGDAPLLLEEPELSLNSAIVSQLAPLIYRLQRRKKGRRQVLVSTHSEHLLLDKGIGGEEVLLLAPGDEGTSLQVASSLSEVRDLLEGGLSIAEAALPRTAPGCIDQLALFE